MLGQISLVLCGCLVISQGAPRPPPIAYPPVGPIRGFVNENQDGTISSNFLGIPYARPPVGVLRFRRPQPHPSWEDMLDATQWMDSCIQDYEMMRVILPDDVYRDWILSQTYGEDCLQLNVFYPGDFIDRDETERLAVMVWIHGGGFLTGSARFALYDGEILARETGTLVVSIDYRLAIFGFMSMEDSEYTGNMGLYDQRLALQWVKDNIRAFGGDPDAVTIFGESAGGMSVSAHMVSPGSRDLFHRAIGQSGALSNIQPPSLDWTHVAREALLTKADCHSDDVETSMNCLRDIPADRLLNISIEVRNEVAVPITIRADGEFIPLDYLQRIGNGDVNRVPSIWGTNPLESNNFLLPFGGDPLNEGLDVAQTQATLDLVSSFYNNPELVRDELISYYFPNGMDDVWINVDSACRMLTDVFFEGAKGHTIDGLAGQGVDVYEYYFIPRYVQVG